ncbi:hypothetical protein JF66_11540 [Cryobacterium sp. MLB-32]|uniref:ABC transporter permease n=1 Tax=Cryobacterium sp. MLB-32 TaxID=1529318 RepID=UPI0004E73FC4|nr:hypothetical protein [Cryobacterium sp. MLB-32]KFF59408.1 hypothetical protein JF66_11540 [Cryobacterium sp. MLB-32]
MNTLGPLLWLRLRRDRIQIPIWVLSLATLVLLSVPAVTASFGTLADREALVRLAISAPSVLMLRGVPQGADVDALLFFQLFTYLAVMVAFMSTFLAVRHSRAEEESGRADLVGATVAGRIMPLWATALHGIGASLLVGAAVAAAFVLSGFDVVGALVCGAALTATGIAFLGIGLLTSQIMRTSRGANGLAAAVIGGSFALRAAGDAAGRINADGLSMTSAWPSWLSPIGWAQQTSAFTANDLSPLLLHLGLAAVSFAIVAVVQSRRDLGASLVADHAGRASAPRRLRGSLSLVWRLQWPSIIGWSITGLLFGLLAGTLGETVLDLVKSNAGVLAALSSIAANPSANGGTGAGFVTDGAIIDVFVAAMFSIVGVIAAAAAMQAMMRMRQEEVHSSAELLLSTPLGRIRWLVDYLTVGAIAGALVLVVAVIGASIGLTRSVDVADRLASVAGSGLAQLPAALLLLAISALLFAVVPRWSVGLSWGVLLFSLFIGQFGGLLGLSDTVRALSPFTHTPLVTEASADWSAAGWMLALSVGLALLAVVGIRRRDLAQ